MLWYLAINSRNVTFDAVSDPGDCWTKIATAHVFRIGKVNPSKTLGQVYDLFFFQATKFLTLKKKTCKRKSIILKDQWVVTQQTFTYSKSTTETLKKRVKYVKS